MYEVDFVNFGKNTAIATDRDVLKDIRIRVENNTVRRSDGVLLIYWPTQNDQRVEKPISIVGVNRGSYDPKSTNAKDTETNSIIESFLYLPLAVIIILIEASPVIVPILVFML